MIINQVPLIVPGCVPHGNSSAELLNLEEIESLPMSPSKPLSRLTLGDSRSTKNDNEHATGVKHRRRLSAEFQPPQMLKMNSFNVSMSSLDCLLGSDTEEDSGNETDGRDVTGDMKTCNEAVTEKVASFSIILFVSNSVFADHSISFAPPIKREGFENMVCGGCPSAQHNRKEQPNTIAGELFQI